MATILSILILGFIIWGANVEDRQNVRLLWLRPVLYGLLGLLALSALSILLSAYNPTISDIIIDPALALTYCAMVALVSVAAIGIIRSQNARKVIEEQIIVRLPIEKEKRDATPAYNSSSMVHATAVVLALFYIVLTMGTFIQQGGISGLAETLADNAPGPLEIAATPILYVTVALLGVGVFVRRKWRGVFQRLGLRLPTLSDWRAGLVYGIGLYGLQIIIGIAWSLVVDPEIFSQQTAAAQAIFAAYSGSLLFGLLLALSAGIGEEILFRGAIQPVFGIVLTSLFFTVLHTQYTLTPAAIIIFVVALFLGRLRVRESTTAAIIAHVLYNFIPFVLVAIAPDLAGITEAVLILPF